VQRLSCEYRLDAGCYFSPEQIKITRKIRRKIRTVSG